MDGYHYVALYASYGTAAVGLFAALRAVPSLWPGRAAATFPHPWREVGWVLLAAVAVLAVGQLYQRGLRLPTRGGLGPFLEAVNQAVIFSPLFVLLWIRRQGAETVWLPTDRVGWRLLVGVILAMAALAVFSSLRPDMGSWLSLWAFVYRWEHVGLAAQVFFEDVAVAMLMVRVIALMKNRSAAAGIVAGLFAAGHIPAMLGKGASVTELDTLVLDAVLGFVLLSVIAKSRDIWWFWVVHFSMDMTQFAGR